MTKAPTKAQRERWTRIAELGCQVCGAYEVEIHHALTGMGGRKDHDKVIGLCYDHHRGYQGIHTVGRKRWINNYGTEQSMLDKIDLLLNDS